MLGWYFLGQMLKCRGKMLYGLRVMFKFAYGTSEGQRKCLVS